MAALENDYTGDSIKIILKEKKLWRTKQNLHESGPSPASNNDIRGAEILGFGTRKTCDAINC
jgi:hypothetical protein